MDRLESRAFERDGFVVVRGCCDPELVRRIRDRADSCLQPLLGPAEFEADVGYPGSPASRASDGGDTCRRLLHAYARDSAFREWATGSAVRANLRVLFGNMDLTMSQCHHNCVMTKHPGFSSATLWHQDIRYWSFDRPELISVWLALGKESEENGALKVIPGSHAMSIDRGRLDRDLFLRPELAENAELIERAQTVPLEPGDVLFFHCRLFHAAGKNLTDEVKLSMVTTYHTADNRPIPDTRSAQYPGVPL
ncbi:MAG: phytanoyl-CoA dioxygenase family protein [Pseudomonadales bacterium]|nr:phytanoyl-CoA dioxygenase family protein [Pseudomonadales bacterium]NIX09484.1 phytanoyl-CoA dioxygenase family protein [Pseudomonadales bacterium]